MFWLILATLMAWQFVKFEPPQPLMSRAGVMTHPACAKFSSEVAVATCEQGYPSIIISPDSIDNESLEQ